MDKQHEPMVEALLKLEELEQSTCNLPLLFSEIFKDEINANDESKIYNGIKRIIKKFADDKESLMVIDEFTRVISGGASLEEIILVTNDEALNPSLASGLTVDDSCNLH